MKAAQLELCKMSGGKKKTKKKYIHIFEHDMFLKKKKKRVRSNVQKLSAFRHLTVDLVARRLTRVGSMNLELRLCI